MSSKELRIAHVHIEKAAGTSLQKWFVDVFGGVHVFLWDGMAGAFFCTEDISKARTNQVLHRLKILMGETGLMRLAYRWYRRGYERSLAEAPRYGVDNLPVRAKVVIGHVTWADYQALGQDWTRTVVVREPLERAVSQYNHWVRNGGSRGWRVDYPLDPDLGLYRYITLPEYRNYQATATGDNLDVYGMVGVSENLDSFVTRVWELKNGKSRWREVERLNEAPTRADLGAMLTETERRNYRALNALDYVLYDEIKRRAGG